MAHLVHRQMKEESFIFEYILLTLILQPVQNVVRFSRQIATPIKPFHFPGKIAKFSRQIATPLFYEKLGIFFRQSATLKKLLSISCKIKNP